MKRLKENKGITLIALIITIIVMLILVGVTVNVALNGGLFEKAKFASERTKEEKEKELILEGYAYYTANKYSKTEDLDYLEEYFLGEDRKGIYLEERIESATGDSVVFDNGIELSEEDMVISEDESYVCVIFEYNDNYYILTWDYDTEATQKLEVDPTLEVQGALVTGNGIKGWKIIFEESTGNSYDLLPDGTITDLWWITTAEEDSEIYFDNDERYFIAKSDNIWVFFFKTNDKIKGVDIVILDNEGYPESIYYYVMDQELAEDLIENTGITEAKMCQWYYEFNFHGSGGTIAEYNSSCPINLNDFEDEELYCRSYLERVIKSFE